MISLCLSSCGIVSRIKTALKPQWDITQYEDALGSTGLFSIAYSKASDTLIVIDGGWTENTPRVREIIKEHGNKVKAWFLTHYHNDHVGALNEILADPQGMVIEKIYTSPIDYDRYMREAQEWDRPEYYTRFLELTKGMNNIVSCARNDEIEFDGLKVQVLNTYDDKFIAANTGDIHNNGCLVLLFKTNNNAFLFLGDVHNNTAIKVIEDNSKYDMHCDSAQMGHHGYNTIDYSFYDRIGIKNALFNAPGWLVTEEQYGAKALIEHFKEKGISCKDFRDVIVTIGLN